MRDLAFKALCDDPTVVFGPRTLGFILLYSPNPEHTFDDLASDFSKHSPVRTPDTFAHHSIP
jgi:hypothetical protein